MQYWDRRLPDLGAAEPATKQTLLPSLSVKFAHSCKLTLKNFDEGFSDLHWAPPHLCSLSPFLFHCRKGYNQLLGLPGCVHVERSAAGWTCQSGWNCCYKLSWHFQRPPEWGCRNKAMKIWISNGTPLKQSMCPLFWHLHTVFCHKRFICYSTSLDKQEVLKGKERWQEQFNMLLDKC